MFIETVLAGLGVALLLRKPGKKRPSSPTSRRGSRGGARTRAAAVKPRKDDAGDIVRRIERGEIRGDQLGELFRSGKVRMKRNPCRGKKNPLSTGDKRDLASARRIAREFHGTEQATVVELDPDERKLPRFAVVAGQLEDFTYHPAPTSKRGGSKWIHASGDRGRGQPEAKEKPLLVVDPRTRRPAIVAGRSPMRFSSKKGFVG